MAEACWLEQWETRWQCCSDLLSYCSAMIHLFNWDELKDSVFLSLLASLSRTQFHTHKHAYTLLDELFILIKEEKESHLSVLFSQVRAHL